MARIGDGCGVPGVNRADHHVRITRDETTPANALEAAVPAADGHPDVDADLIVRARRRHGRMDAACLDDRRRRKAERR